MAEAWQQETAIDMGRCSRQDRVLVDAVLEPDPWGLRMAVADHENQTSEAARLEGPDKGASLADVAAASIGPERRGLVGARHQRPSVAPDNGRLPCGCRPVEVEGAAARCNIPGRGEAAAGDACQRRTTLCASVLDQALAEQRPMS